MRQVELRSWSRADPVEPEVVDHADDLKGVGADGAVVDDEALADRVLFGPNLLREALVHHDDLGRIGPIGFIEGASSQKRDTERTKIARCGHADIGPPEASRWRAVPVRPDGTIEVRTDRAHRQRRHASDRDDARHGSELLGEASVIGARLGAAVIFVVPARPAGAARPVSRVIGSTTTWSGRKPTSTAIRWPKLRTRRPAVARSTTAIPSSATTRSFRKRSQRRGGSRHTARGFTHRRRQSVMGPSQEWHEPEENARGDGQEGEISCRA